MCSYDKFDFKLTIILKNIKRFNLCNLILENTYYRLEQNGSAYRFYIS